MLEQNYIISGLWYRVTIDLQNVKLNRAHGLRVQKIMKVTNEYYQFFGELAIALQTKDIKMSFKTLNKMLVDNGFEPYGSSRALARGLSAAYREWERQEKANGLAHATSSAIANTFVSQNGDPAWWNY